MSKNIEIDTEALMQVARVLYECKSEFDGAHDTFLSSVADNFQEEAGQTEMGKAYAESVHPGVTGLEKLLAVLRKRLEVHGNTYGMALNFDAADAAAAAVPDVDGVGGIGGGRR